MNLLFKEISVPDIVLLEKGALVVQRLQVVPLVLVPPDLVKLLLHLYTFDNEMSQKLVVL